jgi:hypothetical protein
VTCSNHCAITPPTTALTLSPTCSISILTIMAARTKNIFPSSKPPWIDLKTTQLGFGLGGNYHRSSASCIRCSRLCEEPFSCEYV